MKKRHLLIFAAILTLAVILRSIAITTREIQYDDTFTIFLSQQPLNDIISGTAADTMPPLFYFMLHYWMEIFGSGLAALRSLSILLSLLALLVFFDLTRRAFGIEAGLVAAFLSAISPMQIYHAQDIRMYAMLELSQAVYFWCFIGLFNKPNTNRRNIGWWIGLILGGAASLYTHNLAIFGLVIADIYLLVQKRWKDLIKLIAAQAVTMLLAVPWLVMVPGQIEKIQQAFWTPRPGIVEVFQAIMMFSVSMPLKGVLLIIGAVLALQILVIILIETIRGWRQAEAARFMALIAFLLPGILFATSYLMRPVFVPRGFVVSTLAYCSLAGWIVTRPGRRGIAITLVIAFITAAAISLPSFYTYKEFPRSAFREVAAYLSEVDKNDALILHDNKLSYFPIHYYAPDVDQKFLMDEPGSTNDTYAVASQQAMDLIPEPDVQTAIGGYDQVYFVVFQRAIDEYIEMGKEDHPVLDDLGDAYQLTQISSFSDLRVYEFVR